MKQVRYCPNFMCKADRFCTLHLHRRQNGAEDYCWICDECENLVPSPAGGLFIAKETFESRLDAKALGELPVRMPYCENRCVRCGTRQCELHYWMPQAMSPRADEWPKDYLCKACHDEWHMIVTPSLVK